MSADVEGGVDERFRAVQRKDAGDLAIDGACDRIEGEDYLGDVVKGHGGDGLLCLGEPAPFPAKISAQAEVAAVLQGFGLVLDDIQEEGEELGAAVGEGSQGAVGIKDGHAPGEKFLRQAGKVLFGAVHGDGVDDGLVGREDHHDQRHEGCGVVRGAEEGAGAAGAVYGEEEVFKLEAGDDLAGLVVDLHGGGGALGGAETALVEEIDFMEDGWVGDAGVDWV